MRKKMVIAALVSGVGLLGPTAAQALPGVVSGAAVWTGDEVSVVMGGLLDNWDFSPPADNELENWHSCVPGECDATATADADCESGVLTIEFTAIHDEAGATGAQLTVDIVSDGTVWIVAAGQPVVDFDAGSSATGVAAAGAGTCGDTDTGTLVSGA
ncbi:MAG TPA: hypothetical protein VGB83_04105 [Actinomycetota bacterium]